MAGKKEGPGYIYIFWNRQWSSGPVRAWPWSRYYKVGETSRTPEERIREYRTYSPFATEIVAAYRVDRRLLAEKAVHRVLEKYNMDFGGGREFFKRRLAKIRAVVARVVSEVNRSIITYGADGSILRSGAPMFPDRPKRSKSAIRRT